MDLRQFLANFYGTLTFTVVALVAYVGFLLSKRLIVIGAIALWMVTTLLSGRARARLDPRRPASEEQAVALERLRERYEGGEIDEQTYRERYDAVVDGDVEAVEGNESEAPDHEGESEDSDEEGWRYELEDLDG